MKALPIEVYKCKFGDCNNGGITSRYDELLLICDEGFIPIDEENPPERLVKIVTRVLFGREYKHIEPYAPIKSGCVGYMSGGALGYSCDSRFTRLSQYPLSIHDRQETQKQYDGYFD